MSVGSRSYKFAIDGAEFAFTPGDRKSKEQALKKLEAHALKVIEALDAQAGRQLTHKELLFGVAHRDDRTKFEKVQEATAKAKAAQPKYFDSTKKNPYRHALESGLLNQRQTESIDQTFERLAKEWDEKHVPPEEPSPGRQEAIKHAEAELFRLKYDPVATYKDMRAAEKRLEVAKTGDLREYAALDREYREAQQAKLDESTAEIDSQIEHLRAQKAEIAKQTFELPEAPKETPEPFDLAAEIDAATSDE